MPHSKLKDHIYDPKKKKFISPLKAALGDLAVYEDWFRERMPEFLWLGLIFDFFESRKCAIRCLTNALKQITFEYPSLIIPRFSVLLSLNERDQSRVFDILDQFVPKEALSPLTILYTFSETPFFSLRYSDSQKSIQEKSSIIERVMKKSTAAKSDFSTDIAFFVVYTNAANDRMRLPPNMGYESIVDDLNAYADAERLNEECKSVQGFIRCFEQSCVHQYEKNNLFLENFWKKASSLFECSSMYFDYKADVSEELAKEYTAFVKNTLFYYRELYRINDPLNLKFLVILGISVYSYKRLLEIVEHNLFNAISGRSVVRTMLECLLMVKYLLKKSKEKSSIWEEFQYHGIGKYKAVLKNYQESEKTFEKSHVNVDYLKALVNEFKDEEFVDIDISYFDDVGIRTIAIEVGEKDLYSMLYNYDSSFEHGLWGAIRESSMVACQSPGHQYHSIPDVECKQKMKSVWHDCVMIMNKIIGVLADEFGISDELKKRMTEYGL